MNILSNQNKKDEIIFHRILLIIFSIFLILPVNSFSANPQWKFIEIDATVSRISDDIKYIWISTASKKSYHLDKETFTYHDSVDVNNSRMVKDKQGNWWFARYGVTKYDGKSTVVFLPSNSDIPSYSCNQIKIDSKGIIWIGTDELGLANYDGTNWKTYNSSNSGLPIDVFGTNSIYALEIDKFDNVWATSQGAGLTKFDGTNWTTYNTSNSEIPTNTIRNIISDKNGVLWIASSKGITKFDGTNWTTFTNLNSNIVIDRISALSIDSSNNLWLGTTDSPVPPGLIKFDGTNWTNYNISNSEIEGNAIYDIAIDKFGNKWFGVFNSDKNLYGIQIFSENGVVLTDVQNLPFSENTALYPNPARNSIHLDFSSKNMNLNNLKLYIYDYIGNSYGELNPEINYDGETGHSSVNCDVSKLHTGNYIIVITDEKESRIFSFIVE